MSKKHHEKQLARARARRARERASERTRNRTAIALGGGLLVVLLIVGVWWFVGRTSPTEVAADDATAAASPAAAPDTPSDAPSFEPCPVPGDDVPVPDTQVQFDEPPPADRSGVLVATIDTTCGSIVAELDADAAPLAVASFAFLAQEDFYEGTPFHRVQSDFVIQGGDPTGTGTGGPGYELADELSLAQELTAENDGLYPRGTLAMANSGPDSAGSQFFVVQADPGYTFPPAYTVFGTVTEGMDVVDRIANGPVTGDRQDQAVDPTVILDVSIDESS